MGTCAVCEKSVTLEFHDTDCQLTLCNECAGHFAVAEFWLHRYGYYPCTTQYNNRDDQMGFA
jgi:hypothetical protein